MNICKLCQFELFRITILSTKQMLHIFVFTLAWWSSPGEKFIGWRWYSWNSRSKMILLCLFWSFDWDWKDPVTFEGKNVLFVTYVKVTVNALSNTITKCHFVSGVYLCVCVWSHITSVLNVDDYSMRYKIMDEGKIPRKTTQLMPHTHAYKHKKKTNQWYFLRVCVFSRPSQQSRISMAWFALERLSF